MVGDGEPVQGPVNLDTHAVGGDEFLAPDKVKTSSGPSVTPISPESKE